MGPLMSRLSRRTTPDSMRTTRRDRRSRRLLTALAMVLCLGGSMFAFAGPASAIPRRTKTEMTIAQAVQKLINAERKAHHLPAVKMNHDLIVSARRHDVAMAKRNTMSHQLPGEAFFANRITAAGYRWQYAGENIGWNSSMTKSGVLILEKLMYAERAPNNGHRLNILNKHYKDVGVDVYFDKKHHKVWLTTDFGHR
jgi:uncharacterized protein YkwD